MQPALSQRWLALLQALSADLREATQARQWDALSAIDKKIHSALEELHKLPTLPAPLAQAYQELAAAHDQALVICREACESARVQLLQHLQYAEARTAYLRAETFTQHE